MFRWLKKEASPPAENHQDSLDPAREKAIAGPETVEKVKGDDVPLPWKVDANRQPEAHPSPEEESSNQDEERESAEALQTDLREEKAVLEAEEREEKPALSLSSPAPSSASPGWIIPIKGEEETAAAAEKWAKPLSQLIPRRLASSLEARTPPPSKSFDVRLEAADWRRKTMLDELKKKLSDKLHAAKHISSVSSDVALTSKKQLLSKSESKLVEAEQRRQNLLGEKQEKARLLRGSTPSPSPMKITKKENEHGVESPFLSIQNRLKEAENRRRAFLKTRAAGASETVLAAKEIGEEMEDALLKKAEEAKQAVLQRLVAADERRSSLLKDRAEQASRTLQYVEAVKESSKNLAKQQAEILKYKLEAAGFRRALILEEKASKARQSALNATFKTYCAHRLNDAGWLNQALKANSRQATAEMRRELAKESLLNRLKEAELKRKNVLSMHQYLMANKETLERNLNSRLRAAEMRREEALAAKFALEKQREMEKASRKVLSEKEKQREARQRVKQRLEAACQRHALFLHRRRSAAAAQVYKAKKLHNEFEQASKEQAEQALKIIEDRQGSAVVRREQRLQSPGFSQRNEECFRKVRENVASKKEKETAALAEKLKKEEKRAQELAKEQALAVAKLEQKQKQAAERREEITAMKALHYDATFHEKMERRDKRYLNVLFSKLATVQEDLERVSQVRKYNEDRKEAAKETLELEQQLAALRRASAEEQKIHAARLVLDRCEATRQHLAKKRELDNNTMQKTQELAAIRRSLKEEERKFRIGERELRVQERQSIKETQTRLQSLRQEFKLHRAKSRKDALLRQKGETARAFEQRLELIKLTQRAEEAAHASLKSQMLNNHVRSASDRRRQSIDAVQREAAEKGQHAKAVADAQKELNEAKTLAMLQQSQHKLEEGAKRRDDILDKKRQHESLARLQPFAGLEVVGCKVDSVSSKCA